MLIGISIRSVTSKRSCALDGSPSCESERVKANDENENEREEHLNFKLDTGVRVLFAF